MVPTPTHMHSEVKKSALWDISCGVTQRSVDVVNQCKYLASKKGMNLKELRYSIREDEAKQRQLMRFTVSPPWVAHANNHGMIYSQYNVQNYGHMGQKSVMGDHWSYYPEKNKDGYVEHPPRSWEREHHNNNLRKPESSIDTRQSSETAFSSDDSLFRKRPASGFVKPTSSASLDIDLSNDNLVSLLYSANMNKSKNMGERDMHLKNLYEHRLDTPCSGISRSDFFNPEFPSDDLRNQAALHCCKSRSRCQLPARKMASHNLTTLRGADDDFDLEDAKLLRIAKSSSSFDSEKNDKSDSELDFSEIQVIEEIDTDKGVVSPLIEKVESALANLEANNAIFGTLDDFGRLMNRTM